MLAGWKHVESVKAPLKESSLVVKARDTGAPEHSMAIELGNLPRVTAVWIARAVRDMNARKRCSLKRFRFSSSILL